ncbi:hypothetical protein C942_01615 [Photobacterium marinum]|uniref:UPF0319 protein C942_01615 n=1 Tax=Photobacterium marinum TaxID=1056511 RepID=L8JFS2_9GAMM|nr:DUF2057 domain-containing protein [Photobacterium marinum]ELR67685.1 hypothetical protein C942_01615 [Photobacterium marinum]
MKLRTAILALTACGLSFPSLADINLELPYSAELVLVNGIKKDGNEPLVLKNGENQIAFRYQDGYRENGEYQLFKSDVIIVKFNGEDANYRLEMPKLRNEMETFKFNNNPSIKLTDNNGQTINFEQDKLMKSGIQFGRDYEAEMVAYNLTDNAAAMKSAAITTLPAKVNLDGKQQGENVAETMLNYWYEQADPATQARFKARINQVQ